MFPFLSIETLGSLLKVFGFVFLNTNVEVLLALWGADALSLSEFKIKKWISLIYFLILFVKIKKQTKCLILLIFSVI